MKIAAATRRSRLGVDDGGAGEVDHADLAEPAADAPYPVASERINKCRSSRW